MTTKRPKIYLTMIVKNEVPVICRCLDSCSALIDGLIIHDTGSTDGTQQLIQQWAEDHQKPLHLTETDWVDFGTNRSSLLKDFWQRTGDLQPHGAYSLMVDADEVYHYPPGFDLAKHLREGGFCDRYEVECRYGPLTYPRPFIVSNRLLWGFRGAVHEFIDLVGPANASPVIGGVIPQLWLEPIQDGARSKDPDKFRHDAEAISRAMVVETDPGMLARYEFYYAQCLRDAGEVTSSISAYMRRIVDHAGIGYIEEAYVSYLNVLRMLRCSEGSDTATYIKLALESFEVAPERWETRYELIRFLWTNHMPHAAYALVPPLPYKRPPTGLFIETWIYNWGMAEQAALAAYWSGHYGWALSIFRSLLDGKDLPKTERLRTIENIRWCAEAAGKPEWFDLHKEYLDAEISNKTDA